MKSFHASLAAATILSVLLPTAIGAADKPARAERFTYRVLGLFSPGRERDLREAFTDLPDLTLVAINYADAEITLEFVPGKAFPGTKPDQLIEQLDQKVRSASNHTFGIKARRTVPRAELRTIVIPVPGLDCKGCCLAAYESIARIDGVEQATASFKDRKVTALIDPTKTDRAKLEDALRKREVSVGKP